MTEAGPQISYEAVAKRPSAALVRLRRVTLVPQAGSATERDFAKLNLQLDIFHQPLRRQFFDNLFRFRYYLNYNLVCSFLITIRASKDLWPWHQKIDC